VVLLDPSAVETSPDQVEDLPALAVLTDVELGYQLISSLGKPVRWTAT
jgi:hypothetical protein